ncbi:LysR family transcriptional regulator [Tistrella bauzanensis]|uniref:LysR family transcriptional regulator n=1 Tax=Tistrella arctica TaxID=3133430 RepID=A0ABU9YJR4_9PROT
MPPRPPAARPTLSVRIDLPDGRRFGPGKASLLRHVAEEGSIAAAGREMGMSYARAWRLIEAMNRDFPDRLVTRQTGGAGGGGAVLTETGRQVLAAYDAALAAASAAAADAAAMIAALAGPAIEAPATAVIPAPEPDS